MARNRFEVAFVFGAHRAASFDRTFSSINQSIGGIVKGIAGLVSAYVGVKALGELGKQAIDSASSLEGYRSTLNVVLKDSEKAAKTMRWAVNFANQTPFETDSIVEATVRLESYGLKAQEILPQIGDMAGVMNKDIMQAVEAVADAQTGELERLKEFGITKGMLIEKSAQMYRGIEVVNAKGQIVDQEKFNKALFSLMGDRFEGGMELQAGSFKGLMSTVQGIWKTGLASMAGISMEGEIIEGTMFDLAKKGVKGIADTLQAMANSGAFEAFGVTIGKGITFIINGSRQIASKVIPIVINLKDYAVKAFTWVSDIAAQSFGKIKAVVSENAEKFQAFGSSVKEFLVKGLETAKPIIEWIAVEGLPKAIGVLGTVAEKASDFYQFIAENWSSIEPIVMGIGLAFAALKGVQLVSTGITAGLTAAQWALNAAFVASPIGWIVLGIGALIGIGVLLWKNWDVIKAKAIELWGKMKSVFGVAVSWFKGIWDGVGAGFQDFMGNLSSKCPMLADLIMVPVNTIKGIFEGLKTTFTGITTFVSGVFSGDWGKAWEGVKGIFSGIFASFASIAKQPINAVIAIINGAIRGINGINVAVPDWVPGMGGKTFGFAIPEIPALAAGGVVTAPTLALIGEGKEKEAVLPLSKLEGMLNKSTGIQSISFAPIVPILERIAVALKMCATEPARTDSTTVQIPPFRLSELPRDNGILNDNRMTPMQILLDKLEGHVQAPTPSITYSPQYHIQGDTSEEAVHKAEKLSFEEFKIWYERLEWDRIRKK